MAEVTIDVKERQQDLLAWLKLKYGEGYALVSKERAWEQCPNAINYIEGKQGVVGGKALSKIVDNRLRKLALETAAVMTDVRPIWNYETQAEIYKKQGETLNKLARAWWRNNRIDSRLVSILLYALAGGTSYGLLTFNSSLAGGNGDLELIPFDPRDVIPVDPVYSDSIQDWRGIILRQRFPLETVRRMFPAKAHALQGKETSWGPVPTPAKTVYPALVSPQWDVLDGKKGFNSAPGVDVMRAYLKDESLNLSEQPVTMGEGDWAYTVYPIGAAMPNGRLATKQDARLYPRGRLVIFTPETILKDGPNPHWHGLFPVIRFVIDKLPWTLLGSSIIGDLIPMQDSLNEALRGSDDGLLQWVRRSVAADKRAMPRSALDALDTRKAGIKFNYNPAAGEPFKLLDGPAPPVFQLYGNHIEFLKKEIEDTGGIAGMVQLSQMGQMPSADTLERYLEAMSPILRLRARNMEVALSELAELLKIGFFQWYSAPRRIELLGKDGLTREDFDYDPGTMVPGPTAEEKETGASPSRMEKALEHHKLFTFQVAPNSWLNVSHAQQKMFNLQLFRGNMLDPWTIWNQFDIPDAGPMPAETVPERIAAARKLGLMPGPPPEMVQMQMMLQMIQLQQAIAMAQQPPPPPGAPPGPGGPQGPPPGGGGPQVPAPNSQGGRPPSGQTTPHFETRDGGTRPIVAES